jgi:hypothetical protein
MTWLSRFAGQARLHTTSFIAALVVMTASCGGHSPAPESAVREVPEAEPAAKPLVEEVATPPSMPPFESSDESTPAELGHALDQGKAIRREIEWVEREEAVASGEMAAGEYLVTYLITPADDYYDFEGVDAKLPAHHTTVLPGSAHVAVVVRDAADGRMVQGLDVRASLVSSTTGDAVNAILPFGWHPILNRYGENMILPRAAFTLTVHIARPTYPRHGGVNGDRFIRDVTARFADVSVSRDSLAGAAQRAARGDGHMALTLSRQEGTAVASSLDDAMRNTKIKGYQRRSGEYNVTVIVRQARGFWEMQNGTLAYSNQDSTDSVDHIDVSIRDVATGRFVPGLNVRATITDSRKHQIDTFALPFMWHPWMNHYGLNVVVPGTGRYTIRVRADPPTFRRYGADALKKFNRAVDVEVRGVRLVSSAG